MAPEVIQERGYTEAADMWSAGVMMYELFMGHNSLRLMNNDPESCKKQLIVLFYNEKQVPHQNKGGTRHNYIHFLQPWAFHQRPFVFGITFVLLSIQEC